MTPRPDTQRYELLCNFLEDVLTHPKTSKRLKMSAAQRLDDLLARTARREDAEARRMEREALAARKREDMALQIEAETPAAEDPADAQLQRAREMLENIAQKV